MEPTRVDRKLAAILSADVKGYSRLMGENEMATIRTLTAYRELMASLIQQNRGRVVDTPGDNLLAEFGSVVDAVTCAVEVQRGLGQRNAELPDQRKMEFRIGINLGDVVVERERIYGDGVNIAARVESLAEGGGICISGTVYEHVKNKLALGYEYQGEQTVKNIAEPVQVYRIPMDVGAAALKVGSQKKSVPRHRQRSALVVAAVLIVGVGAVAIWYFYLRSSLPPSKVVSEGTLISPLPEKPSIAVLPFQNLSDDPQQEYFSDGITNNIITDLSKFSNLFVIASNSVFTYKGRPVKVKEVGRDLGVRYVLEGSVQKIADRVRINAQLIDAATSRHLWADRYDRDLKDIFAVQDEITKSIVSALKVILSEEEQRRVARRYTDVLEAYDLFLRGRSYLLAGRETGAFMRGTRQAHLQARELFEKAIRLDPKFAAAYAEKSITYFMNFIMPLSRDPEVLGPALEAAQRSVALDDSLPLAHARLGWVYLAGRDHEKAIGEGRRAIALDPNDAESHAQLGNILNWAGKPEEALGFIKKAMRLNPLYPFNYSFYLGHARFLLGQHEEAIALMNRAVTRAATFLPLRRHLAVLYQELGRQEEAQAEVTEMLRIFAWASIEDTRQRSLYKGALLERLLDGLRKAGMPERVAGEKPTDYRMPGLD